jgi:hypothetical protein
LNLDSITEVLRKQILDEKRRNVQMDAKYHANNASAEGGKHKTQFTFSEKTKVYLEPDTTCQMVAELPFASVVIFIEDSEQREYNEGSWIKIKAPNDIAKHAYIKADNLADYAAAPIDFIPLRIAP